jgi:peroxin-14
MAPREDLVNSAVSFLQDPSVASSPLDKRIAFLQSKNLTQEEIDLSLARAGDEIPAATQPQRASYYPPPQQQGMYQQPPGNYNYSQYGNWQAPPPEVPKRDWRDWFIMATVVGGASYGLWVLTQRYIKPLIAPPTPPQLEQDKAAIDEQFTRAFALLDTLSSDTIALKEAEQARTQRLDTTLTDVEAVVAELKASNQRREDESRRTEGEIRSIKDSLPKAIDSVREGSEKRLKELGRELSSLKLLMGNRFGTNPVPTPSTGHGMSARQPADGEPRSGTASPIPEVGPGNDANVTGVNKPITVPAFGAGTSSGYNPSSAAATQQTMSQMSDQREVRSRLYGASGVAQGKATIPAWQMGLAAEKNKATNTGLPSPSQNGTGSSVNSKTTASGTVESESLLDGQDND